MPALKTIGYWCMVALFVGAHVLILGPFAIAYGLMLCVACQGD